jgi:hypothetical protein
MKTFPQFYCYYVFIPELYAEVLKLQFLFLCFKAINSGILNFFPFPKNLNFCELTLKKFTQYTYLHTAKDKLAIKIQSPKAYFSAFVKELLRFTPVQT